MKILKRRVRHTMEARMRSNGSYDIEAVANKVAANIRRGSRFAVACELAGISKSTGYDWLALGEGRIEGMEPTEAHIAFARAVREAEDGLENEMIEIWRWHAARDWRAARDFLGKRFGTAWGKDATETGIEFPPKKPVLYWAEEGAEAEDVDEKDYSWQAALEAKVKAQEAQIEAGPTEPEQIEAQERVMLTSGTPLEGEEREETEQG